MQGNSYRKLNQRALASPYKGGKSSTTASSRTVCMLAFRHLHERCRAQEPY